MKYAFQLLPHANVRYTSSFAKLGKAELYCLLQALGLEIIPELTTIGGSPFFQFDSRELTADELRFLSRHSGLYLWATCKDGALFPLERPNVSYLDSDLAEVLKYKGKTNAGFTMLMINLARSASRFAREERPLTVLDPMCGKGTTLFCALEQGDNAVGLDMDRKDLKEAMDYFSRYLQYHKLKHTLTQSARSLPQGGNVPDALYTLADTREHYQDGLTRSLRFLLCDTRQIGTLLKKTPADLLVTDLPYGVQHAPEAHGKAEKFDQLLQRALPAWYEALRPGGCMVLSFNTHTLRKTDLAAWAQRAGFKPLLAPPYDCLEHFVEQAVSRDLLVCLRA